MENEVKQKLCKCGCGLYPLNDSDYIRGHKFLEKYLERKRIGEQNRKSNNKYRKENKKLVLEESRKLCKCGCGLLANPGRVFLPGHWSKLKKNRAKLSGIHLGKPRSNKLKKQWSRVRKGIPRTEQDKLKMLLGWKKRKEMLKKDRLKVKQRKTKFIKSSVGEDKRKIIHICVHNKLTKPERRLRNRLNCLFPGEYKFVGDGTIFIDYKCPDFININGQKKIIEMFGDYWHGEERTGRTKVQEKNQRIKHFAKYGFKTLIVWESELKNILQLKEKLIKFQRT